MRAANLALRFALEMAVLAAYALWGASLLDGPLRVLSSVLCVVLATVGWGVLVAPKSQRRLADPGRLVAEVLIVVGAGAALWSAGRPGVGIGLTVVALSNAALVRRWENDVPVQWGEKAR